MSDYIPPEIVIEILLKLPVKTLIRCTTVCKSWQSVITSPSFISLHLNKTKNKTLLILKRCEILAKQAQFSLLEIAEGSPFCINSFSDLELPFQIDYDELHVVGSCRGVVCLADMDYNRFTQPILWNPFVKRHIVLPKGILNHGEYFYCDNVLGFGVTDINDFIVVRLVCHKASYLGVNHMDAEAFSLRTGRWRRLIIDTRVRTGKLIWARAFVNGFIYWLGYTEEHRAILSFCCRKEVFCEISLPDELAEVVGKTELSFTSVGESLAVIKYDKRFGLGRKSCEVWLLKEHGVESSWTRWCSFLMVEGMDRVLTLRNNGEGLVNLRPFGLVAFDIASTRTKILGINGVRLSFYVHNYVESLELLKFKSENCREVKGAEECLGDGCLMV